MGRESRREDQQAGVENDSVAAEPIGNRGAGVPAKRQERHLKADVMVF